MSSEDEDHNAITFSYWNGLIASQTMPATLSQPGGSTTTFSYTCQSGPAPAVVNDSGAPGGAVAPCGQLSAQTDPDGHVTRYGYDRYGDRTQTITPTGAVTNTFVDANGYPNRQVVSTPTQRSDARLPGVEECLVLTHGRVTIGPADAPTELAEGDSIRFDAAHPHLYRGGAAHNRAVLLMLHPES